MKDRLFMAMDVEKGFSMKVKALRLFYGLSFRETAGLLHYKSSTNIVFMEQYPMMNKPSFLSLARMQQVYGISLDWLMGSQKEPFTEASLCCGESQLEEKLSGIAIDFPLNQFPLVCTVQQAMKEIVSAKKYSNLCVGDRFVLLFLLHYFDWVFCDLCDSLEIGKKRRPYFYKDREENIRMKKHREYVPTLFQLKRALGEKQHGSVLCHSWDFASYIHSYFIGG